MVGVYNALRALSPSPNGRLFGCALMRFARGGLPRALIDAEELLG
jgi:hypothetical protein